jgi:glycosyltransferase involved in cell wall biosynthesis
MSLTILSVGYPFAAVGLDVAGGSEQILALLDRSLMAAGHRSLVMAPSGSAVTGNLLSMPEPPQEVDDAARASFHAAYGAALNGLLRRGGIDLVHMHGLDFHHYLPEPGIPVLVTLHLPISWYPEPALRPDRPDTYLHAVSAVQHRDAPNDASLLPAIENGIDLAAFSGRHARRNFALMLARICPEKGIHIALDAARAAGIPMILAGEIHPYADHRRYFAEEIQPRLDRWRRYVGPVGLVRKRRLLAAAQCLLIASTVAETSSLVAREALASGTPVVAFARGALPDTIEDGCTGFLVQDGHEMAEAIGRIGRISADDCRAAARARFSHLTMIRHYFDRYHALARRDLRGAA